jgi:hypothetical protein
MTMPGFGAGWSLGPARGTYRGSAVFGGSGVASSGSGPPPAGTVRAALGWEGVSPVPQEAAFTVPPLPAPRAQTCTTVLSGYVTYPMCVYSPPSTPPGGGTGGIGLGGSADTSVGISRQARALPGPTAGRAGLAAPCLCQARFGPWFATVLQTQSCNFLEPDHFTLKIQSAPQPVELKWTGTLQDAPAPVGAVGNLSPSLPTCSCCSGFKQCLDGSCVPPSAPCGPPTPA